MQNNNWKELSNDQAYKLSMSEFKGATIQALKDIDSRVEKLESYNSNTRIISLALSGITGIVAGLFGSKVK